MDGDVYVEDPNIQHTTYNIHVLNDNINGKNKVVVGEQINHDAINNYFVEVLNGSLLVH